MEKTNFINFIVTIILVIAGIGFVLFSIFGGEASSVVPMIIGGLLIIYGVIRFLLINKASKDIS